MSDYQSALEWMIKYEFMDKVNCSTTWNLYLRSYDTRVDGTGGAEGAQAPPSFLDLCSKNYKISQIREENSFFYLVVPPHKKFASVHPGKYIQCSTISWNLIDKEIT